MTIDPNDERLPMVIGRGRFIDDIKIAGCFYAAFLRSPHASAEIMALDTSRADQAPGVHRIIIGTDLANVVAPIEARMDENNWYEYQQTSWPVIALSEVRFVGEIVAVVIASDPYLAEDACALIEVEFDHRDAVVDAKAGAVDSAPKVHTSLKSNVLFQSRFETETGANAFAEATHRVSGSFRHPRVAPAPIECCGALATYDAREDIIELITPSQTPHITRDGLARFLNHPESRVRVKTPDVGGAFGVKMPLYPEEIIIAYAARELGTAVKWTQDRSEHLLTSFHARDAEIDAELAADVDGRIIGLRVSLWCDAGAYSSFPLGCSLEPHTALVGLPGPYHVPYFNFESFAIATNNCPIGPYRGVGFVLGPLVTENLLDKLALQLGIDRAEIRQLNLIQKDAFPYTSISGAIYDSGNYPDLLNKALERAEYDTLIARSRLQVDDGIRTGIGIACFIEPTGMGCNVFRSRGMHEIPAFDSALLRVHRSGSVEAYVTTPSQGQQQFTSMRRILSGMLSVAEDTITVRFGDTTMMPYGSGTFASRGAVTGGGALQRAARRVIERMSRLAALRFEVEADDIVFEDGRFKNGHDSNQFATFEEVAEFAHSPLGGIPADMDHGIQCTASYDNPGAAVSAAAHIAVVEVDTSTGLVNVVKYIVAGDCGPIINLSAVEGQIRGAIVQGIGSALLEEVYYDKSGQHQSATFADYLLPTSADTPEFDIVHQETPSPLTEGGYKGVAESGTIGAPAAIASAVLNALNIEWSECRLPFTPARILTLLSN